MLVKLWLGSVMINLNRGDKQYKDIENFKKYELTHCIAYEMAIRNDDIIGLIKDFLHEYSLLDTPTAKEAISFIDNYKHRTLFIDFFINPYALYLKYHFFKDTAKLIKNIPNFKNSDLSIFFNPKYNYKYKNDTTIYSLEDLEKYYFSEKITNDLFHYDLSTSLNETLENRITPNYSRPLSVLKYRSREKDLNLNLALPTSELVDFIERLKRNKDFKSLSKSIYDFFNIEDEINTTLPPNIQNRFADLFFTYDCDKLGLEDKKIKKLIDDYRYDYPKNGKYAPIKIETVRLDIVRSKDYIENQRYKTLIL